jgi:hypothetical protein
MRLTPRAFELPKSARLAVATRTMTGSKCGGFVEEEQF